METTSFASLLDQTTQTPPGVSSEPACSNGIPGIVSNETNEGLLNFSNSYGKFHGYVAVAVCLFGVLSNTANIIVLTRKNMASSTNTILMWLAVSDLLTMLSYLPFAIHFYIMEPQDLTRPPFSSPEFPWICLLLFHASFSIVCHTIAIWLTIALAIFRYIYICKPTQGAFYCSQQRARKVVLLIIVLTVLVCSPNYAVNTYTTLVESKNITVVNETNGSLNSSVQINTLLYYPSIRGSTPFGKTLTQFNYWVQAILIKLVPCGMLSALTILLVHAMHKAYRKRLKLKSQGRKAESDKHGEHNRTTGMLLAVVVLFTLTELPQGILTLMNIFINCFTEIVYYRLGDLLDIMALTNNSVNFVLYCTMSTQFRNTFKQIFCCTIKNKPKWMKLRLVKSSSGHNRNAIEVCDKSAKAVKDTNKNKRQNGNTNTKEALLNNCYINKSQNDEEVNNIASKLNNIGKSQDVDEEFRVDSECTALTSSEINHNGQQHQVNNYHPEQTFV